MPVTEEMRNIFEVRLVVIWDFPGFLEKSFSRSAVEMISCDNRMITKIRWFWRNECSALASAWEGQESGAGGKEYYGAWCVSDEWTEAFI